MQGLIKTEKNYYKYSKLINIKYIQKIGVSVMGEIETTMEGRIFK